MDLTSLIFLFLSVVSCSHFYENGLEISPKTYEDIAENILSIETCTCKIELDKVSLFYPVLETYLSVGGLCLHEEYEKLVHGLENFIKKQALKVATKLERDSGTMTENEQMDVKNEFIRRLWIVSEEENYFDYYDLADFSYDPFTLKFIFSALKAVDPSTKDTLDLVASFTKYCKTDSQLIEPLSMIYTGILFNNSRIPFIKFNQELYPFNCPYYSSFIRKTIRLSFLNFENSLNFTKNFINGPFPSVELNLFQYVDIDLIEKLYASDQDFNFLIRFVIKSNEANNTLLLKRLLKQCSKNAVNIEKALNLVEHHYKKKKFMEIFGDFEICSDSTSVSTKMEFMNYLPDTKNVLNEYYFFNQTKVLETGHKIYNDISILIKRTEEERRGQLDSFSAAINLFTCLPSINMDLIDDGKSIELILDRLMYPLSGREQRRDFDYSIAHKMFSLPGFKINLNILTKMYAYYTSFITQSKEVVFHQLFSFVFCYRKCDDCFEIFRNICILADSLDINLKYLIQTTIVNLFNNNNRRLLKEVLDYCKEHRLLSKFMIISTERLLKYHIKIDY